MGVKETRETQEFQKEKYGGRGKYHKTFFEKKKDNAKGGEVWPRQRELKNKRV